MARHLRFLLAYVRINLATALEYRLSFLVQCIGMALNDAIIFFFWWLYFRQVPQVGGWQLVDLLLLYGVVATSFGLAATFLGNWNRLPPIIVQGQLDYYLSLPGNVLLHVLVSRMSLAGWGDLGFGALSFGAAAWLGILNVPLAALLVVTSTAVLTGFAVLTGSLAFFLGNAEAAASQANMALVHFSTYPGSIFRGWVKVLLLTAVPAGFVGHVPVELLREFDLLKLALLLGFTAALWTVALLVFRRGLKRYESGNLVVLQG